MKAIEFSNADVLAILIALDLARDAAFTEIREAKTKRGDDVKPGEIVLQLATWTDITKRLEKAVGL